MCSKRLEKQIQDMEGQSESKKMEVRFTNTVAKSSALPHLHGPSPARELIKSKC